MSILDRLKGKNSNFKDQVIAMEKDLLGINAGSEGTLSGIKTKLGKIIGSLPQEHKAKSYLQTAQNAVGNMADLLKQVSGAADKGKLSTLIASHKTTAVTALNEAVKNL